MVCRFTHMQIIANTTERDPVLDEYLAARKAADSANQRLKDAQEKLTAHMAEHQTKTMAVEEDNQRVSITYTQRENVTIDEKGLRKALTAKVYDKYTVKKLDRKAMERAMDDGAVDPMLVGKYVTVSTSTPYLTVRVNEIKEEESQ